MLSPTAVQKLGTTIGNAATGAGSGPFMFGEWVKGDHLVINRNPHYWQKDAQGSALPYLQSIRYRPITNESVMFSNLETGTINSADTLAPPNTSRVHTAVFGSCKGQWSTYMENIATSYFAQYF